MHICFEGGVFPRGVLLKSNTPIRSIKFALLDDEVCNAYKRQIEQMMAMMLWKSAPTFSVLLQAPFQRASKQCRWLSAAKVEGKLPLMFAKMDRGTNDTLLKVQEED
jgi:hypothetical protein